MGENGSLITAGVGIALLVAAIASDFVINSFWVEHAMLTALLASLLIVVITVAVVNEVLDRRDRRRWSLLAQSALFALVQGARLTWMGLVEVLELTEIQTGSAESLARAAAVAADRARVSAAADELLANPQRRSQLQTVVERLSEHVSGVIATWASLMVGAAPYVNLLDRHVELQGRLEWLSSVLNHREPPPDQGGRRRHLTRASVAGEYADSLGDDFIRDTVVSITVLAAGLDRESFDLAFSLVSTDWWQQRMRELAAG